MAPAGRALLADAMLLLLVVLLSAVTGGHAATPGKACVSTFAHRTPFREIAGLELFQPGIVAVDDDGQPMVMSFSSAMSDALLMSFGRVPTLGPSPIVEVDGNGVSIVVRQADGTCTSWGLFGTVVRVSNCKGIHTSEHGDVIVFWTTDGEVLYTKTSDATGTLAPTLPGENVTEFISITNDVRSRYALSLTSSGKLFMLYITEQSLVFENVTQVLRGSFNTIAAVTSTGQVYVDIGWLFPSSPSFEASSPIKDVLYRTYDVIVVLTVDGVVESAEGILEDAFDIASLAMLIGKRAFAGLTEDGQVHVWTATNGTMFWAEPTLRIDNILGFRKNDFFVAFGTDGMSYAISDTNQVTALQGNVSDAKHIFTVASTVVAVTPNRALWLDGNVWEEVPGFASALKGATVVSAVTNSEDGDGVAVLTSNGELVTVPFTRDKNISAGFCSSLSSTLCLNDITFQDESSRDTSQVISTSTGFLLLDANGADLVALGQNNVFTDAEGTKDAQMGSGPFTTVLTTETTAIGLRDGETPLFWGTLARETLVEPVLNAGQDLVQVEGGYRYAVGRFADNTIVFWGDATESNLPEMENLTQLLPGKVWHEAGELITTEPDKRPVEGFATIHGDWSYVHLVEPGAVGPSKSVKIDGIVTELSCGFRGCIFNTANKTVYGIYHIVHRIRVQAYDVEHMAAGSDSTVLLTKSGAVFQVQGNVLADPIKFDEGVNPIACVATSLALAILMDNGDLYANAPFRDDLTWKLIATDVEQIVASEHAIAYVKSSSVVHTWPSALEEPITGVQAIYACAEGFIARLEDQSLVPFGSPVLDMQRQYLVPGANAGAQVTVGPASFLVSDVANDIHVVFGRSEAGGYSCAHKASQDPPSLTPTSAPTASPTWWPTPPTPEPTSAPSESPTPPTQNPTSSPTSRPSGGGIDDEDSTSAAAWAVPLVLVAFAFAGFLVYRRYWQASPATDSSEESLAA